MRAERVHKVRNFYPGIPGGRNTLRHREPDHTRGDCWKPRLTRVESKDAECIHPRKTGHKIFEIEYKELSEIGADTDGSKPR